MKNILLGASISMMSSGGTLVSMEYLYGGWLITLGILAGFSALVLHVMSKE